MGYVARHRWGGYRSTDARSDAQRALATPADGRTYWNSVEFRFNV